MKTIQNPNSEDVSDNPVTQSAKPEEYQNFENLLKQVASVPKADVDRSIKAEKDARAQKRQEAQTAK